ncbi:hypothetical protein HDV06_005312 [Boothiomyces sp. JEL0866]|nr:hypothetical protein HDV06_005312 [Boothiomyces sp. JEL0866]
MYAPVEEDEIEMLEFDDIQEENKSGILDASFNFTNSIVGAGIIGLPYAFKQAGLFTGIVLLAFLAFLVDQTVLLLVLNGKMSGQYTYQGLIKFCYGDKGFLLISIFQFIFAYGAMCAYTVILGDTIPAVLSLLPESFLSPLFNSRSFIIIFCTLFISLPLSSYRDISSLSKTSLVSLVMILFIVLSVMLQSILLEPEERGGNQFNIINGQVFQAIGVISFAFVCHHNTFMIYGSLKNKSIERFSMVTHLSIL